MTHPFSGLPTVGLAVAASLLVTACASGAKQATAPGPEKRELTVAAVPAVDSAALYIAQQRGLFAAEGLHVKVVPATAVPTRSPSSSTGKYDVTVGGYVSYILPEALHHASLRVLAAASMLRPDSQEVVVPAGSPIHVTSQLKGKSIESTS